MGSRGRQSKADLQIVGTREVEATERPQPPAELTKEQAQEWIELVTAQPADWLGRERHGLLCAYCRHIVAQRHVAQLIDEAESGDELDVSALDKLYRMQERESGVLARLAVRLNIAHDTGREKKQKKNSLLEWK